LEETIRRLEPDAIERIIQAVLEGPHGDRFGSLANDRRALGKALDDELRRTYPLARDVSNSKLTKQRAQRLSRIQQTARKLRNLLKADRLDEPNRHHGLLRYYPLMAPAPEPVVMWLALSARKAKMPSRIPAAWKGRIDDYGRWLTARSPLDFLVGERLSEVFEKFFGEKPGYTTAECDSEDAVGSRTDSPFIRFAEAVLRESGLYQLARPSIAKALTNAKKGHIRRKRA